MPTTVNLLRDVDSLVRFPPDSSVDQTAQYLNNGDFPRFTWSVSNGTASVVTNVTKIPSCSTLLIVPSSTADVFINLSNTTVAGTVRADRQPLRYLFHTLLLCAEPARVFTKLTSKFSTTTPKETTLLRDQFTPCRSNIVVFDTENNLPSDNYLGSDPELDIQLQITGHDASPIYLTFPSLIDADGWKYNSSVPQATRHIPTMYRDVDETQDPEYPFYKLIDVLSYRMGESSQIMSDWFRFEPDELPSDALETDEWVRSQLTDAMLASADVLPWLSQVVGQRLYRETYAANPGVPGLQAWQNESYPLDMASLIYVSFASQSNLSISADLIVVPKWEKVVTASANNIDLSTSLIDGSSVGGFTVSTGDRVLLKHQLDPTENGIYDVVASGSAALSRSYDASASGDFVNGKAVFVQYGIYASSYWEASCPDPFTLGTDVVNFNETDSPGVVDGSDLADTDTVLLTNQDDPTENGVYVISSSSPAVRIAEMSTSANFVDGVHFEITGGDVLNGTLWRLFAERPITLGSDPIQIFQIDRKLDYLRSQVSTAMYGHAAGSQSSIVNATRRFLSGDRQVAIGPNSPAQHLITVKTIFSETPGVQLVDSWEFSARVATTVDHSSSTVNEIDIVDGDDIDGVTVASGDYILVKSQGDASQNGIYEVQSSGAATRASWADDPSEFAVGKVIYVTEGDLNGDSYFSVTTTPTTIGVSNIIFNIASTLGSSDLILTALEKTRPLGHKYIHQTVNRFSFTFNSPSLGRLGQASLG